MANSFASAYADEDAARISRLLTSDAQRVSPTDRQSGRATVVAAYKSQFAGNADDRLRARDLEAESGAVRPRDRPATRVTLRGRAPTRPAR